LHARRLALDFRAEAEVLDPRRSPAVSRWPRPQLLNSSRETIPLVSHNPTAKASRMGQERQLEGRRRPHSVHQSVCAEPLGRCAASGHHSANLGDRVTTERCRLSGATEELVPEHRSSARECIAAARRGQKPSDRCRHPGWSPHQSRMYRVSGPQVREVFDGDPSPIALRCEPKVHQGSPPRRPDHCSPSPAGPGSASCQSRGHPAKPVDGETGRYVSKFRTSPKPLTC
jgi:hypothetical protein